MMPGTSDRSKDSYRKRILKKRTEIFKGLIRELNEGISKSPELKASLGSDPGDLSALNLDSHLRVSFARRYSSMLRQIDQALERVDDGNYGICEECGEKIDKKRLEIVPFTPLLCPLPEKNRGRKWMRGGLE